MDFIAMDLFGPFEVTSKGDQYASILIDMPTNYRFCIPFLNRTADTVIKVYLREVYCCISIIHELLTDNGSEF